MFNHRHELVEFIANIKFFCKRPSVLSFDDIANRNKSSILLLLSVHNELKHEKIQFQSCVWVVA